jgi:hypothetical protein
LGVSLSSTDLSFDGERSSAGPYKPTVICNNARKAENGMNERTNEQTERIAQKKTVNGRHRATTTRQETRVGRGVGGGWLVDYRARWRDSIRSSWLSSHVAASAVSAYVTMTTTMMMTMTMTILSLDMNGRTQVYDSISKKIT